MKLAYNYLHMGFIGFPILDRVSVRVHASASVTNKIFQKGLFTALIN